MTVIAWDGKQLAWDSRATAGDRKHTVKKFRWLKDGRAIVVAGHLSDLTVAKRLLDGKGLPDLPKALTDRSRIIVWQEGVVYAYDEGTEARKVRAPDAWGTGQEYALGALECGINAERAAGAACKHSATCGGIIHTITR